MGARGAGRVERSRRSRAGKGGRRGKGSVSAAKRKTTRGNGRRQRRSAPPQAISPQAEAQLVPLQQHYYEEGREQGRYDGGEALLEQLVPGNLLLPEVSLEEVISAGVQSLLHRCTPLLDAGQVYSRLQAALAAQAPCSVVRLGDGELLALAQNTVYSVEEVAAAGDFLPYAGLNVPDLAARDLLAHAVRSADIVGVPQSRRKHYHPLLHAALRAHQIELKEQQATSSMINYTLHQSGLLSELLRGQSLLLIGNAAPELAPILSARGYSVSGVISPVNGFADIDRVIGEASGMSYSLALVSAGIPAVVIAWRIATELGKVALDFGHMANFITSGRMTL